MSEVVSEGDGESSEGCEGSRARRKWWKDDTTAIVLKNRFKFADRWKIASLAWRSLSKRSGGLLTDSDQCAHPLKR